MAKKEEKDVGARIVELNTKVSDAKAEKTLAEKKIEEITKELKEKGIKVEDLSKTIEEKEKEMKELEKDLMKKLEFRRTVASKCKAGGPDNNQRKRL